MLALLPCAIHRARPAQRVHDAGARLAATASRRWFLDHHAEFWLRELGARWSLTERSARVVRVIDETSDTRTLVLAPGRGWPGHRAGQYVPLELEIDGVRTRRCYSISSGSSLPGARRIEITVRRVPVGRVSTALHQLRRGARLGLGVPTGDFVVEPRTTRLLFVAGGSGITPIRAMLRDLAAARDLATATTSVAVVHVARGAHDAIFAAELASLATRFPWLQLHAWRDQHTGRLDATTLHALVPDLADRETFVCGPPGLIDLVHAVASSVGAGHRVHHERFAAPEPATTTTTATIQLLRSDTRVVADGAGSLLVQLERAGQRPAHGCRMGICNTCRCRKRTGTIEDLTTGAISSEPDQDIRLCVSVARSDLALDL